MRIVRDEKVGLGRIIWFGTGALIGGVTAGWRGAGVGVLVALAVLLILLAFSLWGARREARGQWPYDD